MKKRILLLGVSLLVAIALIVTFIPGVWAAQAWPDVTGNYTIKCAAQMRYLDDTKVRLDSENITKCKTGTLWIISQTGGVVTSANLTLTDTNGDEIWEDVPLLGYLEETGSRKLKMALYTANITGEAAYCDPYVAVMDCRLRLKSGNVTGLNKGRFLGIDASSDNSCSVYTIFTRWKASLD